MQNFSLIFRCISWE